MQFCWSISPNRRYAKATDRTEALVKAGSIRLRPILMTTLAMIFGMLAAGAGNRFGRGTARRYRPRGNRRVDDFNCC